MKTTAEQIAETINADGSLYYDKTARAWNGNGFSRIYFGRDYVTIEADGRVHNETRKTRAKSIGQSAVDMVEAAIAILD